MSRYLPRKVGSCFKKESNDVPPPKQVAFVGSEEREEAVVLKASLLLVPLPLFNILLDGLGN